MIRGFCQASACCCTLIGRRRPPSAWFGESKAEVRVLLVRGVVGFGGIAFGFLAVLQLPLVDSQVIAHTVPFFAAGYAWMFLGERWHKSEFVSALAAIVGVVFIVRPKILFRDDEGLPDPVSGRVFGVLFGLLSAVCAAGAYVIIRFLGTQVSVHWSVVLLYQACGQMLFAPLGLLLAGQRLIPLMPSQVLCALCVGALGFGSQAAMTFGMQREKSATASLVRQNLVS